MKNILAAIAAFAFTFTLQSASADQLADLQAQLAALQAQLAVANGGPVTPPDDSQLDARAIARGFVSAEPDHYNVSLWGNVWRGSNYVWTNYQMTMNRDLSITWLTIDDDLIPLSEPLKGIPLPDSGVLMNMSMVMNAYTVDNREAGHGYMSQNVVTKGDMLSITLIPAGVEIVIDADADVVNGIQNGTVQVIIDGFEYGFSYGIDNGKIVVYLPPVGGEYHYSLRRWSDGLVLSDGTIRPYAPAVEANDGHLVVNYLGGVSVVHFTQPEGTNDYASIQDVVFNCRVPMPGGSVATGKVIAVDAGAGALDIAIRGNYYVIVQSAQTSAEVMPIVPTTNYSQSGDWPITEVRTGPNARKLVITFIPMGGTTPTPTTGTWISLQKFFGVPGGLG